MLRIAFQNFGGIMFWYEDEIKSLEKKENIDIPGKKKIVFYGSSSIRMWSSLEKDFPEINAINLGFGGATLAASAWFFERILLRFKPDGIVVYAGDNDLGEGRHPEEIFLFLKVLLFKTREYFGNIPFSFISIKPSPSKYEIFDRVRFTNHLIKDELSKKPSDHYIDTATPMMHESGQPIWEYFQNDGVHLSAKGYQLWARILHENLDFISGN